VFGLLCFVGWCLFFTGGFVVCGGGWVVCCGVVKWVLWLWGGGFLFCCGVLVVVVGGVFFEFILFVFGWCVGGGGGSKKP